MHKRSMLKRIAYLSANTWCAARLLPVPWWMVDLVQASYTHTNAACSNTMPTLCKHLVCSSPTACAVVDGAFGTGLIHAHKRSMLKRNAYLSANAWCAARLLPVPWWMVDLVQASYTHTHKRSMLKHNAYSLQTPGVQLACCLCRGGWCIWARSHWIGGWQPCTQMAWPPSQLVAKWAS